VGLLTGSIGGAVDVQLYPEVVGTDGAGNPTRRAGTTPTTVRMLLQPVSSTETAGSDRSAATVYRGIATAFPAGAWARVRALGRDWDLLGEPTRRADSGRTSHVTVLLAARTAEPLQ
jgi:hypothetical protein